MTPSTQPCFLKNPCDPNPFPESSEYSGSLLKLAVYAGGDAGKHGFNYKTTDPASVKTRTALPRGITLVPGPSLGNYFWPIAPDDCPVARVGLNIFLAGNLYADSSSIL
jgi:hypothetical protein